MNNENTLFLITYEGERYEDHIPICIKPLETIKNYVTDETFQKLTETKGWVRREEWYDGSKIEPEEDRKTLEDIRTGRNEDENDYSIFFDYITVVNFHPILLDNENSMSFKQT
jgi:hypothetical protein